MYKHVQKKAEQMWGRKGHIQQDDLVVLTEYILNSESIYKKLYLATVQKHVQN